MKAAPKFDVDLGRAVANAEKLVQRFGCEPQIAWDTFPSLILKCIEWLRWFGTANETALFQFFVLFVA